MPLKRESPMRHIIFTVLISGILLCPIAQAQENLPPQVKAEIEEARAFCKDQKDQKDQGLIMGVDFIERRDINGDGIDDFILHYDDASCGKPVRWFFCGTGGCTIQVFASVSDEGYVTVWDDVAYNVSFERLKGRPAMSIELHGVHCGLSGAEGTAWKLPIGPVLNSLQPSLTVKHDAPQRPIGWGGFKAQLLALGAR
jgi:hypothetical protein